jgi:predicted oxidoreductase
MSLTATAIGPDGCLWILNRAVEGGVSFWDAVDLYGTGRNEEVLGMVLANRLCGNRAAQMPCLGAWRDCCIVSG